MKNLVDIVKKAGFTVVDVYGDGSAITAFNDEMELYDDVLLLQQNELLFYTHSFPTPNYIAALFLVNELNLLTESGIWTLVKEGEEGYLSFFCRFDNLQQSLTVFTQNYLRVMRALRFFREEPMSGRTLAYCATLCSDEDEIPEEALARVKHIQILYDQGHLQEVDISEEDVVLLAKIIERDCQAIHRENRALSFRVFRSLRNVTINRRKLERL